MVAEEIVISDDISFVYNIVKQLGFRELALWPTVSDIDVKCGSRGERVKHKF